MFLKLKNLFLSFAILFLLTGTSFFFAYNWNYMGNYEKLSLPLILILLGIIGWFFFQKNKNYRQLCLFSSSFFIGTLFAVFGQIYQTGADSYILFRNWGFFIILFSIIEKFYPLWILNITIFTISIMKYIDFFYDDSTLILFSGGIFLFFCFFVYVILSRRMSSTIKRYFFNLISFSSIIFLTLGFCSSLVSSKINFYDKSILGIIFTIIMILFFLLNKKTLDKSEIKIFQITSITFVISSFVINNIIGFKFYSLETVIFGIFFIICLFLISLIIISKKYKNSCFTQSFISFFKIFLIILTILFFLGLSSLLGLEELGLYLGGIFLIFLANFSPKYLKFKKENIEIITFISGLILIFLGIMETITSNKLIGILIIWIIYGTFWIGKKSMALDFLSVPTLIFGLYFSNIIPNKFESIFVIIPLIILLISLIYNNSLNDKLKRILRGTEISAMISIFSIYLSNKIHIGIYIIDLLIMVISLIIFYKIFHKKNINLLISIGLIILLIEFFILNGSLTNLGFINLGIMFTLFYIFKEEKKMLVISILFLGGQIISYYYNLDIILIKKSYMLLESSALLFLGYYLLNKLKLEVK